MNMLDISELQKNWGPLYNFMPLISVIMLLTAKISLNFFIILLALVISILLAAFQYSIRVASTRRQQKELVRKIVKGDMDKLVRGDLSQLPKLRRTLPLSPKMFKIYLTVILIHFFSYLYLIWVAFAQKLLIFFIFQLAVLLYGFALVFILPSALRYARRR